MCPPGIYLVILTKDMLVGSAGHGYYYRFLAAESDAFMLKAGILRETRVLRTLLY